MKKETIYRIFSNIPTLETERFLLRKMSMDDTDDMYEYARNADVTKYLSWSPHPDKAYTFEYLSYLQNRYKTGDFFDWSIVCKDTGKMIGTCGFTSFDIPNNSAEVGYVLSTPYWGQEIAPEALRAVITFGFEVLELNRIEAHFMPDNHSSRRVLEKCMMLPEGVRREAMYVKGGYIDIETYAITAADYKKITNR